jgi:hypothetical protein
MSGMKGHAYWYANDWISMNNLTTLRPGLRPAYLVALGAGLSSATASAWA